MKDVSWRLVPDAWVDLSFISCFQYCNHEALASFLVPPLIDSPILKWLSSSFVIQEDNALQLSTA